MFRPSQLSWCHHSNTVWWRMQLLRSTLFHFLSHPVISCFKDPYILLSFLLSNIICVRFEVLTAVKMLMLFFWVVMLCGLVGRYQCFGGTYCLHLQLWIWRWKNSIDTLNICFSLRVRYQVTQGDRKVTQPIPDACSIRQKIHYI
jgi:hypothetical protein